MAQRCEGCGNNFKDLTRHRAKCARAYDLLAGGLKRCVDEDNRRQALRKAKKQQWEDKKKAQIAERKAREAERRAHLEEERAASTFRDMVPSSLRGLPSLLTPVVPPPLATPSPLHFDSPFVLPNDPDIEMEDLELPPPQPRTYVEDAPEEHEPHADNRVYPLHTMDLPPGAPRPPYYDTTPNDYGIFRRYTLVPKRDPEEGLTTADFADAATHLHPAADRRERNPLHAFGATFADGLARARDVAARS
ncbi:hypothetical protein BD310DRAFT_982817, partial [Dichomitus squalens]